jgi:hypothetical protein
MRFQIYGPGSKKGKRAGPYVKIEAAATTLGGCKKIKGVFNYPLTLPVF